MDAITAWGTAVAALAAVTGAFAAVRALRVTQRTVLLDQYLSSYGEMFAALAELSQLAEEFDRKRNSPSAVKPRPTAVRSRLTFMPAFQRFAAASRRVGMIEPSLTGNAEFGEWVRHVANNLAVNILQADEFAAVPLRSSAHFATERPKDIDEEMWLEALLSSSYQAVLSMGLPPPRKVPRGFVDLERWWRPTVTGREGIPSYYGPAATYFSQMTWLLDAYVSDYLIPWSQSVIAKAV